jgi:hypothetical protein
MKIQEAKDIILKLCDYEKRITIRNLIVYILLFLGIIALIYLYALPQFSNYFRNAYNEVAKSPASEYLKFVIPLALFLTILQPIKLLYSVLKRKNKVEEVFKALENGATIQIFDEETKYLTIIPLIWVKLKLNPIKHLHIAIDNKSYQFPIDENQASDIKSSLHKVDLEKVYVIKNLIYGNSEVPKTYENSVLKSISEFQLFAKAEFEEDIENMETSRKTNKSMFIVQVIFAFLFMGTMIFFTSGGYQKIGSISIFKLVGILIGVCVLASFAFLLFHKMKNKGKVFGDYTQFKKKVYSKTVNYINPDFEYAENGHITLPEFLHSGMFTEKQYSINGSDQIAGIFNGVPFQTCNLSVEYRPQLRNEKEPNDSVFNGNYFVARFNKNFNYPIYIFPKKGIFGDFNDNDIATYLDGSRKKIELEDPDFDKQFTVYCDDQIMARYVLTSAMMERLKSINTRNKGNLYIAINNRNIVIATNETTKSGEIGNVRNALFKKLDLKVLHSLYEELYANIEIINTLKLNINIWK